MIGFSFTSYPSLDMNEVQSAIRKALGEAIHKLTGLESRIATSSPCSGGCIHQAEVVTLEDGRQYFVKSGQNVDAMFAQEAIGLTALQQAEAIRIPQVVGQISIDGQDALILEAIQQGRPSENFFEQFGIGLAKLHQQTSSQGYGWHSANWIGSTPQSNHWCSGWPEFFAKERIEPQLKLAQQNGNSTSELLSLGKQLLKVVPELLQDSAEPPALLHGDLWSGNFMCDTDGQAVIFDPATYFGHREMEFAMTKLFGGFSSEFYVAYSQVWPLQAGWEQRVDLYQLYHLLNHLNLFGASYHDGCLRIMRRFT